jgi:UPF0755 protein
VLADEARDGLQVGAERGAMEGEEGLRGEAEGVGDGEADTLVTDVDCEDAEGCGHGVSLRLAQGSVVHGAMAVYTMRSRGVGLRFLKVLVVAVAVAAGLVGFYGYVPYGPAGETFVEIAPGTGAASIGKQLEKAGVVRSAIAFEVLRECRGLSGTAGTLKAGEYRFDHAATVGEVYDRLRRGDVYTVTLVVPEGFNIFDTAQAVQAAGLGSKEEFLAAERSHTELISQWTPHAESLEGFLFPDTYKFGRHATAAQMLSVMVKRFGQQTQRLGFTGDTAGRVFGVVTMASLVEKEVHVDAERAVVASVFRNRLAAGMPLQTDPAVIYASMLRGTWTGVIHQSELRSDSAYNTYTHAGLPPGPICSPGVAALRAAMHPAQTDYLYFVADANGSTRFSATLAGHNANVAAYRAGAKP